MENQEINRTYNFMLDKRLIYLICILFNAILSVVSFLFLADRTTFWPWLTILPILISAFGIYLAWKKSSLLRFSAYPMVIFGFLSLNHIANIGLSFVFGIIIVGFIFGFVSLGPADDIRKHEDPAALAMVNAARNRRI